MNTMELIKVAKSLGLEYYNECPEYICVKGINGHAEILYTTYDPINKSYKRRPATMLDFANHLKQMGRDSLKMDLERLLSITSHN